MGFWSINPYVGCAFGCAYCYARYTHRWVLDRHATRIPNTTSCSAAHGRCRRGSRSSGASSSSRTRPTCCGARCDTDRRSISRCSRGETIVIGTATDPFQPAERRFRVTRSVLEVLAEHPGLSICIITKSPLITRDIDLLTRIDRHLVAVDSPLAHLARPRARAPHRAARAHARSAAARARAAARGGHRDRHQRDAGAAGDHRRVRRRSSDW